MDFSTQFAKIKFLCIEPEKLEDFRRILEVYEIITSIERNIKKENLVNYNSPYCQIDKSKCYNQKSLFNYFSNIAIELMIHMFHSKGDFLSRSVNKRKTSCVQRFSKLDGRESSLPFEFDKGEYSLFYNKLVSAFYYLGTLRECIHINFTEYYTYGSIRGKLDMGNFLTFLTNRDPRELIFDLLSSPKRRKIFVEEVVDPKCFRYRLPYKYYSSEEENIPYEKDSLERYTHAEKRIILRECVIHQGVAYSITLYEKIVFPMSLSSTKKINKALYQKFHRIRIFDLLSRGNIYKCIGEYFIPIEMPLRFPKSKRFVLGSSLMSEVFSIEGDYYLWSKYLGYYYEIDCQDDEYTSFIGELVHTFLNFNFSDIEEIFISVALIHWYSSIKTMNSNGGGAINEWLCISLLKMKGIEFKRWLKEPWKEALTRGRDDFIRDYSQIMIYSPTRGVF